MKCRPGDQPLPVRNDQPDIQSMVIADITRRREVGIERYGTALQANNGRDALRDAYEEAIDLAMYLRQAIEERDHPAVAESAPAATIERLVQLMHPDWTVRQVAAEAAKIRDELGEAMKW